MRNITKVIHLKHLAMWTGITVAWLAVNLFIFKTFWRDGFIGRAALVVGLAALVGLVRMMWWEIQSYWWEVQRLRYPRENA